MYWAIPALRGRYLNRQRGCYCFLASVASAGRCVRVVGKPCLYDTPRFVFNVLRTADLTIGGFLWHDPEPILTPPPTHHRIERHRVRMSFAMSAGRCHDGRGGIGALCARYSGPGRRSSCLRGLFTLSPSIQRSCPSGGPLIVIILLLVAAMRIEWCNWLRKRMRDEQKRHHHFATRASVCRGKKRSLFSYLLLRVSLPGLCLPRPLDIGIALWT